MKTRYIVAWDSFRGESWLCFSTARSARRVYERLLKSNPKLPEPYRLRDLMLAKVGESMNMWKARNGGGRKALAV